jgi:hypothetical protein
MRNEKLAGKMKRIEGPTAATEMPATRVNAMAAPPHLCYAKLCLTLDVFVVSLSILPSCLPVVPYASSGEKRTLVTVLGIRKHFDLLHRIDRWWRPRSSACLHTVTIMQVRAEAGQRTRSVWKREREGEMIDTE